MLRLRSTSRVRAVGVVVAAVCLATAAAAGVAAAAGGKHRAAGPGVAISGRPSGALAPGRRVPIDLRLTDRRPFALRITRLVVTVRGVIPRRGCAAGRNFRALPFRGRYPIVLRPGRGRTLAQLGYPAARWPDVAMLDTGSDQAACRGAHVTLAYAATASRAR
jgi:hypothetical protein